jgi:transposase
VLKQEVEMYDTYQQRIAECDRELEAHLKSFADKANSKEEQAGPESKKRKGNDGQNGQRKLASSAKRSHGNAPHFDLRGELCRVSGVDLTRIHGIHVLVAQTVISEVGLDMSRWSTERTLPRG